MPKENTLVLTMTYEQNEWLSANDREWFEDLKKNDYQRYLRVVGKVK